MKNIDAKELWLHRQVRDFAEDRRDWMREVMGDTDLEPTHRLIAVAIALRINHETEESWPSIAKIAEDTGTSPRTVIRAIKILAGEDEVVGRDGTITKPSKGKHYLIVQRRKRGGNRYSMNIAKFIK